MRFFAAAAVTLAVASASAAMQTRPALKAPAAPKAAAPREAAVPFAVGETLTFDVSWSQFITAGTAVTRVVEKRPSYGSTAYYIVADGRPVPLVARFYPLYYKMDTLLDSFRLLSQWTSLYSEERDRKHETSTRFDRAARRAFYEDHAQPPQKDDFEIPADVQDGLATLYTLRSRLFKAGERFTIPVSDDGTLYSVGFETSGPVRVRVPYGDIDAWNLKISIVNAQKQAAANNTAAWISTDASHLPVKLQSDLPVGSFVLALRERQP